MPKHIVRLVLLILAVGVIGYAAKTYFTADSFYEYGHYRGASVAEIASDKPKYQGTAYCQKCHAQQYAEWSKGVHNSAAVGKVVKCEVCHGPAGRRDPEQGYINSATGPVHPDNVKLVVPTDTAKLCTLCHEQMPGRPQGQPQIVVATHAGTTQCTTCHNPHSPRIIGAAAAATGPSGDPAAGKAKAEASNCAACHGPAGVSENLPGPSLAGQKAVYLVGALKAYKTGARENPLMGGVVGSLSDADIGNLAAFYAGSSCKSAQNGEKKAAAAGQAIVSKCAACHGIAGISTQPAWPNLAGMSSNYLAAALQSYKNGGRKDATMSGMTKDLSDADAANLAAYFSNASCK